MALVFCDSFDIYNTAYLPQRYASIVGSGCSIVNNGRTGVNALNVATSGGSLSYGVLKNVLETPPVTAYCGMAIYVPTGMLAASSLSNFIPVLLHDWASAGLGIRIGGDGSLQNQVVGISAPAGTFSFGTWHYLETAFIVGSTTLEITIWLDDNQVADGTVTITPYGTLTGVWLGVTAVGTGTAPNGTVLIDDFVFYDNTGSFFNVRTGDVDVFEQMPNGPGRVSGVWTNNGGGGSQNWQNVNQIPPSGGADYITDATAGDEECFSLTASPQPGAPLIGAQVTLTAQKSSGSGARTIAAGIGNGSNEGFAPAQALTTSYQMIPFPFSNDPVSGGAFDPTITYQAAVETIT